MTSISAAKHLRTRVETYLAGVFHPFPEERVIAGTIQSFYGWFFPLLRNAVICGALQYFADASGSMTLQILAIIGYVVLAAYCFSYINMWVLTPFHFVKHKRLGSWLDGRSGQFYNGLRPSKSNTQAYDGTARERLRVLSLQLTGLT